MEFKKVNNGLKRGKSFVDTANVLVLIVVKTPSRKTVVNLIDKFASTSLVLSKKSIDHSLTGHSNKISVNVNENFFTSIRHRTHRLSIHGSFLRRIVMAISHLYSHEVHLTQTSKP